MFFCSPSRLLIALVLTIGAFAARLSHASCLELPSPAARDIDEVRYADPTHAGDLAAARLAATAPLDPQLRAELTLVLAFARAEQSRTTDARTLLAEVRRQTALLPDGPARHRIELRTAMASFGVSFTQTSYEEGRANLDRLVQAERVNSIEWACLLVARGDFAAEMDRPDLAVADQLTSYRTAKSAGWTDAQMTAAFGLASSYRRGGLWADAHAMIDEVRGYATPRHQTWYLALLDLTDGQIFVSERRWDEAYAALARGEALATSSGDTDLANFATGPECEALLSSGRIEDARKICASKFSTFMKIGRTDLATDGMMFRARLDLLEGRDASALAMYDLILTQHLDDVPPRSKPVLYRERAQALSALGRYREAALDLERALAAADAAQLNERKRTAAVLSGIAKSQAFEAENEALARLNRGQQRELDAQRKTRQLTVGLALAGVAVSAVLGYLLLVSSRQRRALARQAAVLDTMNEGVLVVDDMDRITLANSAMHELLRMPLHSLEGTSARALTPKIAASRDWERLLAGNAGPQLETCLRRPDGSEVLVSVASSRMGDARRGVRICVCRDISEQRRIERAVAGATGRAVQRVSGTLHENLAQELAGVAMLLGSVSGRLRHVDEAAGATAREVARYLSDAIHTARRLALLLSPIGTTRGSLGDALRTLAAQISAQGDTLVTYEDNGENVDVDIATADELYRIARDAVEHAVQRHCTEIDIGLSRDPTLLCLSVSWVLSEPMSGTAARPLPDWDTIVHRARLIDGALEQAPESDHREGILISIPLAATASQARSALGV